MQKVKVVGVERLTPLIKRFTFERSEGGDFPSFTGGSHVIVKMQKGDQVYSNAYSLMSKPDTLRHYQICVRLEETGKGGSKFLHEQVNVGDELELSTPNNLFALAPSGQKHVLIAGGIGITPFIPQLEELQQRGANYELHYSFRAPEHGALYEELAQGKHAEHCHFYINSENVELNLEQLLSSQPPQTHVYVCGPKGLIDAVVDTCNRLRYRDEYIHWEKFSVDATEGGSAFTVVLAKSGLEVEVPADKTILQAIESHDVEVECLCREGVCGTCETTILEGEAEHLDQYLSDDEKAAQKTMMICVSRAKGNRIVLDL